MEPEWLFEKMVQVREALKTMNWKQFGYLPNGLQIDIKQRKLHLLKENSKLILIIFLMVFMTSRTQN